MNYKNNIKLSLKITLIYLPFFLKSMYMYKQGNKLIRYPLY